MISTDNSKKFTVYMHISPSNKKYIGITCQRVKKRWRRGKGYENNSHFFNAINKYGWDSFKHIIIKNNLIRKEACTLEKKLIKKYNTTDCNFGYNKSIGGELSSLGFKHSEELNIKQSKRQLVEFGGKNANSKEVYQYTIDGKFIAYYGSLNYAQRKTGVSNSGISMCCRNKTLQAGGYIWRFSTDIKSLKEIVKRNKEKTALPGYKGSKIVIQYDLDGNKIKEFPSAVVASKETGTDDSSISNVCCGREKTANGFIWKFKEKK